MRRGDRLFDIIQLLRGARGPLSAAQLAARLEVSVRTVYRDVAALQASGVPVEGASGFGYVLGPGYDLPPLAFTPEECQTIAVALDLVRRTGDSGLAEAAARVRAKIGAVLPPAPGAMRRETPFFVWPQGAAVAPGVSLTRVREAIRTGRKVALDYVALDGAETRRIVWPLAIAYFAESTLLGTWCELRGAYRQFRADRIRGLTLLEEGFPVAQPGLIEGWQAIQAAYVARVAG